MEKFNLWCCSWIGWLMWKLAGKARIKVTLYNQVSDIYQYSRIWWLPTRFAGIALGRYIFFIGSPNDAQLKHELAHVAQQRDWGLWFFPLYGWYSLVSKFTHGTWYYQNKFEVAARKAELD